MERDKAEVVLGGWWLGEAMRTCGKSLNKLSPEVIWDLCEKLSIVLKKDYKTPLDLCYIWWLPEMHAHHGLSYTSKDARECLANVIYDIIVLRSKEEQKKICTEMLGRYCFSIFAKIVCFLARKNRELLDILFENSFNAYRAIYANEFNPQYIERPKTLNIVKFFRGNPWWLTVMEENGPDYFVYLEKANYEKIEDFPRNLEANIEEWFYKGVTYRKIAGSWKKEGSVKLEELQKPITFKAISNTLEILW